MIWETLLRQVVSVRSGAAFARTPWESWFVSARDVFQKISQALRLRYCNDTLFLLLWWGRFC